MEKVTNMGVTFLQFDVNKRAQMAAQQYTIARSMPTLKMRKQIGTWRKTVRQFKPENSGSCSKPL